MPIYTFGDKSPDISPEAFVHPDAVIIGDVLIGPGCFIAPGAVLRADFASIRIYDGTSIQDHVVIHVNPEKEVIIENDTVVGHGVLMHDTLIKSRCVIGMGSVLLFDTICEEDVYIAAGSVVTRGSRIQAGKLAAGNPAKVVRDVTPEQLQAAKAGALAYQWLCIQYPKNLKRIG
ncbi:MAG: gamma carbonic anhydrase family protein [Syntrophales bacterium]|jgi:phenylacetic acid degradation protein